MSGVVLEPTWDVSAQRAPGLDGVPAAVNAIAGTQLGYVDKYVPLNAGIIQDVSADTIGDTPVVNSTINCFVSSVVGAMALSDVSADYSLIIGQNQNQSQESLAYDNIFDVTLTPEQSIMFLKAFTLGGLNLTLPEGFTDQLAGTASCSFSAAPTSDADITLQNVIRDAVDAQGNTAAQFLGVSLNQLLKNINVVSFSAAHLTEINRLANLNENDLTVNVVADSGVVQINVPAASGQVASVCYGSTGGATKLINQIDTFHLNAYADASNNTIKTTAFPALAGDTFVFGLKTQTKSVTFNYSKAASDATFDNPNGTAADLDRNWQSVVAGTTYGQDTAYNVADSLYTLAFRMTMGGLQGVGLPYPVSTAGALTNEALPPTTAWGSGAQ